MGFNSAFKGLNKQNVRLIAWLKVNKSDKNGSF